MYGWPYSFKISAAVHFWAQDFEGNNGAVVNIRFRKCCHDWELKD